MTFGYVRHFRILCSDKITQGERFVYTEKEYNFHDNTMPLRKVTEKIKVINCMSIAQKERQMNNE